MYKYEFFLPLPKSYARSFAGTPKERELEVSSILILEVLIFLTCKHY
jgi:hypothetical protein